MEVQVMSTAMYHSAPVATAYLVPVAMRAPHRCAGDGRIRVEMVVDEKEAA